MAVALKRVLGVDYGNRRIGLAISDAAGVVARPLATVERWNDRQAAEEIAAIAAEEKVDLIVVGLPVSLSGEESHAARAVRRFAGELEKRTLLPIAFHDERLTTAEVEKILLADDVSRAGRKRVRDQLAAALILQSYLDQSRGGGEGEG